MRLFVKHTVSAVGIAASQAVEELGGAGQMIVGALEDALDVPAVIASAPPLDVASQVASATSVATTALAASFGEAVAPAKTPLIHSVVSQTLHK